MCGVGVQVPLCSGGSRAQQVHLSLGALENWSSPWWPRVTEGLVVWLTQRFRDLDGEIESLMIEHRIGATNVKSLSILDYPANYGEAPRESR